MTRACADVFFPYARCYNAAMPVSHAHNPYAPPAHGEPTAEELTAGDAMARAFRHRVVTGIAVAVLVLLVLSGIVMRVGLLQPTNLLTLEGYSLAFSLHELLIMAVLPLVTLAFAPSLRPTLRTREEFMFGMALLASVAAIVERMLGDEGALQRVLFLPVVAVLAQPVLATRTRTLGLFIALVVYVAARFCGRWDELSLLALPAFFAGLLIGWRAFRAARSAETRWEAWVRRAEAICFVEGVVLSSLLQAISAESHLRDTYVATAALHFSAFVLLLALLRSRGQLGRSWIAWGGLIGVFSGMQLFGGAVFRLGQRGMPMRYRQYLDQFTTLHVVASCGAFLLGLGGLLIVVALLRLRSGAGSIVKDEGTAAG